jgi:hypothetical protein
LSVLLYKSLDERDYDTMWVPLLEVSFFKRCHTVSLLSSIFILVFSSIKFDTGFIDKNYLLTILESMPIKIFRTVKIVVSRAVAHYVSCDPGAYQWLCGTLLSVEQLVWLLFEPWRHLLEIQQTAGQSVRVLIVKFCLREQVDHVVRLTSPFWIWKKGISLDTASRVVSVCFVRLFKVRRA